MAVHSVPPVMKRPTYLEAIAWTAGAVILLQSGVLLSAALRPGAASDLVVLGSWDFIAFAFASWGIWVLYGQGRTAREALGFRATHPSLFVLGVALGFVLQAPAQYLGTLVERLWPPSAEEQLARALPFAGLSSVHAAFVVLIVACLVPLAEELFFRGALFAGLRRHHAATGTVIVTSIAFVASHQDPRLMVAILPIGAVLGWLRSMSGSVIPGLALHAVFNTVSLVPILAGWVPLETGLVLSLPMQLVGTVICVALLFASHRASTLFEVARLAREEDSSA
jgi:membrane protease YdiL (CAAX protease family)